MNDNPRFEIAVTIRSRGVPQIHPAASVLAIGWRHEVGVVEPAAVLRVRDHGIVARAPTPEVVLLEVAGDLVEAVSIVQVVDHVRGVEELRDGGIDVLLRLCLRIGAVRLLGVVGVVKLETLTALRAVVLEPAGQTLPILVREDLDSRRAPKKNQDTGLRINHKYVIRTLLPRVVVVLTNSPFFDAPRASGSLEAGITCHPRGLANESKFSFSMERLPSDGSLTPHAQTLYVAGARCAGGFLGMGASDAQSTTEMILCG